MRIGPSLNPFKLANFVTLFVALTGLAGPAYAAQAPFCSELFTYEQGPQGRVSKHVSAPTPYSAKDIENFLSTIDKLIRPLEIPTETHVTVGAHWMDSALDRMDMQLYMGIRRDYYASGKNIPPAKSLVPLAHEYGHAVLEKNLLHNLESYRSVKEDFKALTLARLMAESFRIELEKLTDESEKTTDPTRKEELLRKMDEVSQKIERITRESGHVVVYFKASSALHEFFADAVAITRYKDPKVIEDAIRDYSTRLTAGTDKELLLRNFSPRQKELHAKAWQKILPWMAMRSDIYSMMLPARWEMWQLMKTHIESPNYQATLIPKVYKAVEKALAQAFAWSKDGHGATNLTPAQVQRLNDDLIRELRDSL